MTSRRLDHVVHAVDDLEAAGAAYEDLGFTVTPRADHPFGTSNRLVVMAGSYVEVVAVTRPELVPDAGFAAEVATRLRERGPGVSHLVLGSDDAALDTELMAGRGLTTGSVFEFSRPAPLPDGTSGEAAFQLVFTQGIERLGLFLCRHLSPEVIWHRSALAHANGARRIVELRLPLSPSDGDRIALGSIAGSVWRDERLPLDGTTLVTGAERPELWVTAPSSDTAVIAGLAVRLEPV